MRVIKRTGHRSDRCTYLGNHPQDRDIKHWTSLVFQWFRLCLPMQKSWVRSLVGELRPHILWSVAQKKRKKKKMTQSISGLPASSLMSLGSLLPPSAQAATPLFCHCRLVLPFLELHINGVTVCGLQVFLCVWLASFTLYCFLRV